MNSFKKVSLYLMLSALILLSGCGQIIGEAIGQALAESMPQLIAASVTQGILGIGFGHAYYQQTRQWPQSVEQIEACCIENDGGDICNLLGEYEQIEFETNEADPNTVDFEIVFVKGGKIAGNMKKENYPQDFTFKDVMQAHLAMAAEILENIEPNALPSD
jgi:hypothetical protein